MNRFRRMKTLQKFSSVHASLHNLFNQERAFHRGSGHVDTSALS